MSRRVWLLLGLLAAVWLLKVKLSAGSVNVESVMASVGVLPRGIRNNNPGNIRDDGTAWKGRTGSDGAYIIFDTSEDGIRALAKVLFSYRYSHNLTTVQGIITRWAPPSENDTASYISDVAGNVGVDAGQPLDFSRPQLLALMQSIINHENGMQPYTDSQLLAGIRDAGWQV